MKIRTALTGVAALLSSAAWAASLPPGSQYVSLGSSYAAGPGVGIPDPGSASCARSQSNYARQVAAQHHLTLVDVACSGATTANILDHGQHGFAAQIEAVTAQTRLTTVLVGGNDVAYIGNLMGLSCRDTGGSNCRIVADDEVDRRFKALPQTLEQIVAQIRTRAPKSAIIMIGYLPAIPADGTRLCPGLPLTPDDAARMHAMSVRLAQAIGTVAAKTGVGIVRSSQLGLGHDVCAQQPFVAGYRPPHNPGWRGPVPYHPDQAGMDRIATAIDEVLAGLPSP